MKSGSRWAGIGVAIAVIGSALMATAEEPAPVQGQKSGGFRGSGGRPGAMRHGLGQQVGDARTEMQFQQMLADDKTAKEIGLTDEQITSLKKSFKDLRTQMIDLEAAMQKAAMAEADLVSQESPDEAALMKAVEETSKAHLEIAKLRMKQLVATKKALTPEQRQKLKDLMKERMSKRQGKQGEDRGPWKRGGNQEHGDMQAPPVTNAAPGTATPAPKQ